MRPDRAVKSPHQCEVGSVLSTVHTENRIVLLLKKPRYVAEAGMVIIVKSYVIVVV